MLLGIMRATGFSVGLKIISAAMTFLTTILIARALSASGVGVFALAGVAATVGAIIVSAGFDALTLKLGARDSAQRTERRLWRILSVFLIVSPASVAVATGVVAVILVSVGFDLRNMLAPVALQTIAIGAYRVVGASIQARGGIILSQIGELFVRPAVMLALTFMVIELRVLTELGVLWIMAAGAAVCLAYAASILALMIMRRRVSRFRLPPRNLVAHLAAQAPSFAGFFAVVLLIEQIDILMLGALRGQAEAGLYQPASRVAWLASLGAVAVSIIARPQIAQASAQRDRARIRSLMHSCRAVSLAYFIVISVLLFFFLEQIFALFGSEYENAGSIVLILLILHGVTGALGPVDSAAQVVGSGGAILARSLISLGVFLVVGFILIPSFGAYGAAVAAVVGGASYRLLFFFYVRRRLGASTPRLHPA